MDQDHQYNEIDPLIDHLKNHHIWGILLTPTDGNEVAILLATHAC